MTEPARRGCLAVVLPRSPEVAALAGDVGALCEGQSGLVVAQVLCGLLVQTLTDCVPPSQCAQVSAMPFSALVEMIFGIEIAALPAVAVAAESDTVQ